MDRLEPCPQCRRHVRLSETSCPFCAADVRVLSALPERAMPATRLGRAALFAFGAGAAALAANTVACTDEPDPDIDDNMDQSATKDAGHAAAGGGGASDAGSAQDAGGGITRLDSGTLVALYGLALPGGNFGGGQPGGALIPDAGSKQDAGKQPDPAQDAGRAEDAGHAEDAGRKKDAGAGGDLGGAVALYGLAPLPVKDSDASVNHRDGGSFVALYGLAFSQDE